MRPVRLISVLWLIVALQMPGPTLAQQSCPCVGCGNGVETVTPCDPNEKIGPDGFSDAHFVRILNGSYTIFFENQASAGVPAQKVVVIDDLPAALDGNTIQLGDIAFGSQVVGDLYGLHAGSATVPLLGTSFVVQVTVTFDSASRRLQWVLDTLDPKGEQLPDDAGLLPQNDSTGRGEGHVSFTVQPRAGLATGTLIANSATIVFEPNAGITTNTWVNTIDIGAPSSHVLPLPAVAPSATFDVAWSGHDDTGGSGIAGFTVMVSDNDGPFSTWLTLSTATSTGFTGLPGHTYKFFSIAQDNVGNVESKTPVAEATTTVSLNSKPIASAGQAQTLECSGDHSVLATLDGTGSHDSDGNVLTYVWSAPSVIFDDLTSPTPSGRFPVGYPSKTTTTTLVVNDGSLDSDPATVEITVQDTQPPTLSLQDLVEGECTANSSAPVPVSATCIDDCGGTTCTNDRTAQGCDATGSYPLGDTQASFTCTDEAGLSATGSNSTTVRVADTTPPTITCPGDVTAQCQSAGGTLVQLPPATASDICQGVSITNSHTSGGADASGSYGAGDTAVLFTAEDGSGNHANCQTHVLVEDTQPPTLTDPVANPAFLWPTDHKLRDVRLDYASSDSCSPVSCVLAVSSNEPVSGTGNGDASPDWVILDDHHLQLRAERDGSGSGRVYTISVTCTDASGRSASKTASVQAKHDMGSPKSGSAFKINTGVSFTGSFLDVPGKSHAAQWLFDSGAEAAGTVSEPTGTKVGTVKGSYTFPAPAVYAVQMKLTDTQGLTGTADSVNGVDALVVAYDPNGGYVLGGGWFDSPPGSLISDPAATGKVGFGFVSKYFKNATNPKGETEFDFRAGNLKFNALNFDYLMVSGAKAMYKGFGKINGESGYSFILTVIDGQAIGGGGTDKLRMRIWNKTTRSIIYDNQPGAPDNADPIRVVGDGSNIVIQP